MMGSGLVGTKVYKTLLWFDCPHQNLLSQYPLSGIQRDHGGGVVKAWSLVAYPVHGFMCLSAFSTYKKEGLIWVHSFRDLALSPLGL